MIDTFAPGDTGNNTPVVTSAPISVTEENLQSTVLDVPGLDSADADITEAHTAPTPQKQQAQKNSSPASSKQGKKLVPTKK